MLPHSLAQIVSHPDVQRTVPLTRENIDKETHALWPWVPAFAGTNGVRGMPPHPFIPAQAGIQGIYWVPLQLAPSKAWAGTNGLFCRSFLGRVGLSRNPPFALNCLRSALARSFPRKRESRDKAWARQFLSWSRCSLPRESGAGTNGARGNATHTRSFPRKRESRVSTGSPLPRGRTEKLTKRPQPTPTCQMSRALSRAARSAENQPMRAVFRTDMRHQSRGERHSASTSRCAFQ